jgi:hypothetical protein
MARQVASIPSSWREQGIRYVPDVDGNRQDPDPFWVRLRPLTANESMRIHSAQAMRGLRVRFDAEGKVETGGEAHDVWLASEAAKAQVIRTAVLEVGGYSGRHGETGEVIQPKTGAELMDFIERHAWQSEAAVIEDLYRAVTDRTHLEASLGEASASRSATSSRETPASGGLAPDAAAQATSTTPMDLPKPTSDVPEGATGATA